MGGPLGAIIGRFPTTGTGMDGDSQTDGGIIRHNRRCRDLVFLFVFIAFWVAMIVNSSFGFNQGNPLRLNYGLDYKGNICGDRHGNPDIRELEVKYYMNPNQVYQSGTKDSQFSLADAKTICLMECPLPAEDGVNFVCDYPEGDIHLSVDDWIDRDYDYFEFLTPDMRNSSLQLQGPCYPVIFPSVNVFWSCQYIARASNSSMKHWQQMGGVAIDENMLIDKTIHKAINSRSAVLKRYVADIGKSWPVLIVCGWILPLFLSVMWLLMIRYFVAGMTWITVILFNALIISVTMFYYIKAGWIGNDPLTVVIGASDPYVTITGREINHLRAATILMTIIMIIAFLTSLAIARRILIATSVLKVAAKVIGEVQALIIFPILPYFVLAIFYLFWFSATLHLFSSGQVQKNDCNANCCSYDLKLNKVSCDNCCGYSVHYTPHIGIAILFHLFGCYWATQFILACSSTVIAGSVASYYWARGEISPEIPFLPVFASLRRLARYSLGSVALGSLVVSVVEWIRFILDSLRRRLKYVDTTSENFMGRTVSSSSQCCLGCIDWTLRSINRNAYIMIAITGKSFCKASSIATGLIMNNILRIGKVNVIGDVILFLGKLCVSLFCALFAFLMLDTYKYKSAHNKISSPLFPVLVCWALGYIVATLFFAVVEMSIDTIILSFCQDAEEHQGNAQYAPPLLMETLDGGGPGEMQRLTQGP
ncbi:Choline transporter-like protein 2 [Rhynchospora pubera]|uniref:Choline transporter-like protein n=1 Tax=Rhynchospora pubera TaxID=906938 RepID=A0AAV8EFC7_9POAL|nr:Choline transporter-like protein 2 [Rhynchospora pubera]KAJ4778281.1 Choline transporter-like protein 2 [Rhynchospora pubera]